LSGFLLDLAQWGVADPAALAFLDPPPAPAVAEGRALLCELGAIDAAGRITREGRKLRQLPLPPRLARMVADADDAELAADIAVVLTERSLGGNDVDLGHRLDAFRRDRSRRADEARRMARQWAQTAGGRSREESPSVGAILALAYPDRVAKNRGNGTFLLANGRGAAIDQTSPLARAPFLAVAEVSGTAAEGRIVLAAPLSLAEIEHGFAKRIETREETVFDERTASLRARRARRLGALVLNEQSIAIAADAATARMLAEGAVRAGLDRLPWSKALRQWRERVSFMRRVDGDAWPDVSDKALAASAHEWLADVLMGKVSLGALSADELFAAVTSLLPRHLWRRLDIEAPTHFTAPSGSSVPIDYSAHDGPRLSIRVQELFGLGSHPTLAGGRVPLVVELLSPAHRPVQVTRDLPGFWRGSYRAVKSEMKGRYPRHPWPDDPLAAPATRRAKPRGT
jgi:ATP-dependent helicase HrpB